MCLIPDDLLPYCLPWMSLYWRCSAVGRCVITEHIGWPGNRLRCSDVPAPHHLRTTQWPTRHASNLSFNPLFLSPYPFLTVSEIYNEKIASIPVKWFISILTFISLIRIMILRILVYRNRDHNVRKSIICRSIPRMCATSGRSSFNRSEHAIWCFRPSVCKDGIDVFGNLTIPLHSGEPPTLENDDSHTDSNLNKFYEKKHGKCPCMCHKAHRNPAFWLGKTYSGITPMLLDRISKTLRKWPKPRVTTLNYSFLLPYS